MIAGRHYAARQSQGARHYQEDRFGFLPLSDETDDRPHGLLAVLADGMGGHKGGAEASTAAVDAFLTAFSEDESPTAERLSRALGLANDRVGVESQGDPELEGMGCTLVGAAFTEDGLQWVSVGDSPFWLFRKGELIRLNDDHSMAPILAEQVAKGVMSAEEAARHPQRNALRSAVVGEPLALVDLNDVPMPLEPGDRLVLSSDGLETLSEDEIAEVLRDGADDDPESLAARLLAAVEARQKKGQDNTTVIIVEPFGVERAPRPAPEPLPDPLEVRTIVPERVQKPRRGLGAVGLIAAVVVVLVMIGAVYTLTRGLWPFGEATTTPPAAATQGGAPAAPGGDAKPPSEQR